MYIEHYDLGIGFTVVIIFTTIITVGISIMIIITNNIFLFLQLLLLSLFT